VVGSFSTLLSVLLPASPTAAEQVEIAAELERLAQEYGFSVTGLEQTEEIFGSAEGEELFPRLRRLLENFDHVIVQSATGGVDRIIVLGAKIPFEPPPPTSRSTRPETDEDENIVMQTARRGSQHLVQVSLEGKGGSKVERELQLDTGADYLVLPLSLLSELGMDKQALKEREMQTANGKVEAHIGTLPSLWLGESRITDIETAFLEDSKLGNSGLLGMSVLKRFKLTIDDEKGSVTLGHKEENGAGGGADDEETGSGSSGDEIP